MDEAKKLVEELKVLMARHDTESVSRATEILAWFKGQSPEVQKILDNFLVEDIDFVGVCLKETQDLMNENNHKIVDYDAVLDAEFGKDGTPERTRAEEEARLFFFGVKTREEYEWAMARVEELLPLVDDDTPKDDPNSIELEKLSNLVADYSDKHFAIGEPPHDI